DVGCTGGRHLGDGLATGRIDGIEGAPALGVVLVTTIDQASRSDVHRVDHAGKVGETFSGVNRRRPAYHAWGHEVRRTECRVAFWLFSCFWAAPPRRSRAWFRPIELASTVRRRWRT